ncbi:MAG TPA: hypothetical protein V6D50_06615 [Chroococcales cyanobacterium]
MKEGFAIAGKASVMFIQLESIAIALSLSQRDRSHNLGWVFVGCWAHVNNWAHVGAPPRSCVSHTIENRYNGGDFVEVSVVTLDDLYVLTSLSLHVPAYQG